MKFIYNTGDDYQDVSHSYYDLYRFDDNSEDEVFFYGYSCCINDAIKKPYKHYKRKVYYEWANPCPYFSRQNDAITSQLYFDEVYTICPYTAEYINNKYFGITKQIPVPYTLRMEPFKKYISDFNNKIYDIIYQGQFNSEDHQIMYNVMKDYKHVICSIGPNNHITHNNISTMKKMELVGQSKISLASNLLYHRQDQIDFVKHFYTDWKSNNALCYIDYGISPQFKSRVMDAAFCKTLNLIKEDPWNVIEMWFKPDKEFIYYKDEVDLKEKVDYILKNFDKYIPIIENAYQKVLTYDIDIQIKKIINKEKMYNE